MASATSKVAAPGPALNGIKRDEMPLQDRQPLEDLRMHRSRIAIDLKARTGFDCRSSIAQIEQDIAGR
ncbi:hypothetical protein [Bradyrhizobium sp. Arg816]|uniref:hypothetical protein n=1 Tax=Bradyrhizobium sp. Arg816 TaxID=2998491 RepID=UPI00249E3416|nr:hypothetical protein [Bradyrhizobium sp. Arg816]MDI3560179.1 hypothetical protein [Bradyrhizobium sp. Arg816]